MCGSCTRFDNSGWRVDFTVTIFTRALLDNAHIRLCASIAIKFTLISCKNIQFTVLVHVVRFATRLRKSISMRCFRLGGRVQCIGQTDSPLNTNFSFVRSPITILPLVIRCRASVRSFHVEKDFKVTWRGIKEQPKKWVTEWWTEKKPTNLWCEIVINYDGERLFILHFQCYTAEHAHPATLKLHTYMMCIIAFIHRPANSKSFKSNNLAPTDHSNFAISEIIHMKQFFSSRGASNRGHVYVLCVHIILFSISLFRHLRRKYAKLSTCDTIMWARTP